MPRLLAWPTEAEIKGTGSAGAKLDAALAGLEGLSQEDMEKVAMRMKEMMGKG